MYRAANIGNPTPATRPSSAVDFTLTSSSNLTSYVSASWSGGGTIAAAIAHTSDQVNETTFAQVGSGRHYRDRGSDRRGREFTGAGASRAPTPTSSPSAAGPTRTSKNSRTPPPA